MKRYLSPEDIANAIQIERRYPGKNLYAFLLVEGSTDECVYKHFVAGDKCQIVIAHSKENAINTLAILEKDHFLGVVAIIDADFMILEEIQPSSQNLLLTDMHDLELMIVNSPALEKVLLELGSRDKLAKLEERHKKDIRSHLIECAMPIGYLRWISLREKLALKFEALKFDRFIDREALTIDLRQMITSVQGHTTGSTRSQRPLLKDDELHERIQQLSSDAHDPWHVCCGHDVVAILSIGLRKAIGSNNSQGVEPDYLEMCLRLAYERSYFCQTQLYATLHQWELVNTAFVVLKA